MRLLVALAVGAWGVAAGAASTEARDPSYVVGYATATLELNDSLPDAEVAFEAGTLTVDFVRRPALPYDHLLRSLAQIEGVEAVEIRVAGEPVATSAELAAAARSAEEPEEAEGYDLFLLNELFDPLIADPRWPRFSASHVWFFDDDELDRVGSANFGETFVLVRSPEGEYGQWEVAFQAGVFSVFDLEASSSDLVNSDFWVGLNLTHHIGDLTGLIRVYHQSSHLGDEYLLRNRVNRVNLSFEVLDALLAWTPTQWLRLYAGGGVIVHHEPELDRGLTQMGVELKSPLALAGGYLRPIAAFDLQLRQESDWKADSSVRGGVRVEHPFLRRSRLDVLGEFYTGRSPNGQFYDRRIRTLGIGVHLGF